MSRVPYQALAWFQLLRSRDAVLTAHHSGGAARRRGARTPTGPRTSRPTARDLPRPAAPRPRDRLRLPPARARAPARESSSGRPTASTGRSLRWRSRTPAGCWCRPTAATPVTRWPTSSTAPARDWSWRPTASSAAPRSTTSAAARPASVLEIIDIADLAHMAADPATSTTRRAGVPRRRGRHPVHLGHDRTPEGRDERTPADDRRGRRVGQPGRRHRRGSLPRGEPLLPLLRLQDRHRRRAAHRCHALPGRGVRRRRDDAA